MEILLGIAISLLALILLAKLQERSKAKKKERSRREYLIAKAATLEPIQRKVALLDLSAVTTKLKEKERWSTGRLQKAELEYRQLLVLFGKYPGETFAPFSEDCDLVWHYHIQHTAKYQADCEYLFGRFVHHNPELKLTPGAQEKADARSRELRKQEFGSSSSSNGSCGNLIVLADTPTASPVTSPASISSCGGSSSGSSSSCGGGGSASSCGGGSSCGSSCGGGGCGGGGCGGS